MTAQSTLKPSPRPRWSEERAERWQSAQPWTCGFNYVPSSAVNSTEMWQADTFDAPTINRELGWAKAIGFNAVRVFLQYLVWQHDAVGYLDRIGQFLDVAAQNGISVMPILFDDCAFSGREPYLGAQHEPRPGIHNSGWTASPGHSRVIDQAVWPQLRDYTHSIIGHFAHDARINVWDLYNEPGNATGESSLPLLRAGFDWAREAAPSQPLTAGLWSTDLAAYNQWQIAASDVISFHQYSHVHDLQAMITQLEAHHRPLFCTEWMSRKFDSNFETHLPIFKKHNTGCYNWGLVQGRTQTHYPWESQGGAPEPELWFHDLLYPDGRAYREHDIQAIRRHTSKLNQ